MKYALFTVYLFTVHFTALCHQAATAGTIEHSAMTSSLRLEVAAEKRPPNAPYDDEYEIDFDNDEARWLSLGQETSMRLNTWEQVYQGGISGQGDMEYKVTLYSDHVGQLSYHSDIEGISQGTDIFNPKVALFGEIGFNLEYLSREGNGVIVYTETTEIRSDSSSADQPKTIVNTRTEPLNAGGNGLYHQDYFEVADDWPNQAAHYISFQKSSPQTTLEWAIRENHYQFDGEENSDRFLNAETTMVGGSTAYRLPKIVQNTPLSPAPYQQVGINSGMLPVSPGGVYRYSASFLNEAGRLFATGFLSITELGAKHQFLKETTLQTYSSHQLFSMSEKTHFVLLSVLSAPPMIDDITSDKTARYVDNVHLEYKGSIENRTNYHFNAEDNSLPLLMTGELKQAGEPASVIHTETGFVYAFAPNEYAESEFLAVDSSQPYFFSARGKTNVGSTYGHLFIEYYTRDFTKAQGPYAHLQLASASSAPMEWVTYSKLAIQNQEKFYFPPDVRYVKLTVGSDLYSQPDSVLLYDDIRLQQAQ
ncbi:hypothetical protein [Marinibactrum halimedae]|uniref:Uncharacterized protein n=1 Tax=Marinibactrum halimedae TaxID=1444977 RepID=A0AA37TBM4_9GAMM|nr:hypothetical protein [Marinibactrum halimedae]MCD9458211.1 hypothetical protein [Marinibactrum halimedae]GLS27160.1 hypothetical protein GCM10007877_28790 [Marinibactrum halimedae]